MDLRDIKFIEATYDEYLDSCDNVGVKGKEDLDEHSYGIITQTIGYRSVRDLIDDYTSHPLAHTIKYFDLRERKYISLAVKNLTTTEVSHVSNNVSRDSRSVSSLSLKLGDKRRGAKPIIDVVRFEDHYFLGEVSVSHDYSGDFDIIGSGSYFVDGCWNGEDAIIGPSSVVENRVTLDNKI